MQCEDLKCFDPADVIPVMMGALVKLEKYHAIELRMQIAAAPQFAPVKKKIHAARDEKVARRDVPELYLSETGAP